MIKEIRDEDFDQTIEKHPLVLVDFWAAWCHPCKMVAPVVEEIARKYQGKILCAKLNVDENPIIPMRYQIASIPTLLLFKEGKLVDVTIGAVSQSYLDSKIKRHL